MLPLAAPVVRSSMPLDPYPLDATRRRPGPASLLAAACGVRTGTLLPARAGAVGSAAWAAAGYRLGSPQCAHLAEHVALRVIDALDAVHARGALSSAAVGELRSAGRGTTVLENELSLHAAVSLLHLAPAALLESYIGHLSDREVLELAYAAGATRSRFGECADLAELARRTVLEAACATAEWMLRSLELHLASQEASRVRVG